MLIIFPFFSEHCTIRSDSFHLSCPATPCKGNTMEFFFQRNMFDFTHTGSCPHRFFLFHSMQGMGWTCQGASDVLYSMFCLKTVKEPRKLSYGISRLLQQLPVTGSQSVSPQCTTKSGFFPGKVLHTIWASYPLKGGQWERGSVQSSVWIKKGDLNY